MPMVFLRLSLDSLQVVFESLFMVEMVLWESLVLAPCRDE